MYFQNSTKCEVRVLSEMNSNEVASRCYANGNANKADEVPVRAHRILHIPLLNRLEKRKKKEARRGKEDITNP